MKVGIMQPYFFPYIGYWQLINAVDKFVVYDDVNFIKGGWINRNRILVNNQPKMINVQMQGASPNKLINEIMVSSNPIASKKLLKTISNCYSKAPFFNEIYPLIEEIINYDESNLAKYIENSIKRICAYLNIHTEIIVSSEISKNNDLTGQDKVIEICKTLDARGYINAIGGKELYSHLDFLENGLELSFIECNEIKYEQYSNEFVPNLSIIDIMMFNSIDEITSMLSDFDLI